jgi:hypothetical protein
VSQPIARFARPLQHAVDVGRVLAGERAKFGLPGKLGIQSAGVGRQFVQVIAEFPRRIVDHRQRLGELIDQPP